MGGAPFFAFVLVRTKRERHGISAEPRKLKLMGEREREREGEREKERKKERKKRRAIPPFFPLFT